MNILILIIATAGLVLNIRRKWQCFLLWMASNSYWCWYNAVAGEYVQSVIFGLFFVASIYGAYSWSHDRKHRGKPPKTSGRGIYPATASFQGNTIQDFETIESLNKQKDEIVRLAEPFCRRIIAIKGLKPWDRVKVNWLFAGAQRILEALK
jgi:hypothetical protein